MPYKELLLKLKNKVDHKANFRMEVVHKQLHLFCCLFTGQDQMIPLPLQHYVDKKKSSNNFDPYLHIEGNKVHLLQKIPLTEVISFRDSYQKFSKKAEFYKGIIDDLRDHSSGFSFL